MRSFRNARNGLTSVGLVVVALIPLLTTIAYPWGSKGHRIINLGAVMYLPGQMATLKTDSVFYGTHASDADSRKSSGDTSFFAEAQRHFIDIDSYPNYLTLSHNRDSVVAQYGWETVKREGTLPWATKMVLDSLTVQLRRGDANAVRYTMSDLGHYVADAHQPLHSTVNYDGQYSGNNGIHSRYETGMINSYGDSVTLHPESIQYVVSPLDFMFAYINHSNALVDSVLDADNYAKGISGWNGNGTPPAIYYRALWEKTRSFTEGQFQRAAVALASLWYTGWVDAGRSTSVHEIAEGFPDGFTLEQNYPNPFNPVTNIGFRISDFSADGGSPPATIDHAAWTGSPGGGLVRLGVYDVLGREVAVLVNEMKPPGVYTIRFDATGISNGVYFYRLSISQPDLSFTSSSPAGQPVARAALVLTKKLVILK